MSLGHYLFGFGGRINRAKMWAIYVVVFAIDVAVMIAGIALGQDGLDEISHPPPWGVKGTMAIAFFALMGIAFFWSMLAITVKRLHDRNKSAWWLLFFYSAPIAIIAASATLGVIPKEGSAPPAFGVALLVLSAINLWYFVELFVLRGTEGPNRFGPDPLHSL